VLEAEQKEEEEAGAETSYKRKESRKTKQKIPGK
jgi:hypothetical protein